MRDEHRKCDCEYKVTDRSRVLLPLGVLSQNKCGFAAAHCGKPAAFRASPPLNSAARLSLAADTQERLLGKAEPGGALPHCAAAKPQFFG